MRVFVQFDQLDERLETMREQRRDAEGLEQGLRRGCSSWPALDPLVDGDALARALDAAERLQRGIGERVEYAERIAYELGYAYRDLGRVLDDCTAELAWRVGTGD